MNKDTIINIGLGLYAVAMFRQLMPTVDLTKLILDDDKERNMPIIKRIDVEARDHFIFSTAKANIVNIYDEKKTDYYWSFCNINSTGRKDNNYRLIFYSWFK